MIHLLRLSLATSLGKVQTFSTGALEKFKHVDELHPELAARIGMVAVAEKEELVAVTGVQAP